MNINKHLEEWFARYGSSNNLDKIRATGCRTPNIKKLPWQLLTKKGSFIAK
jgi:hypothetical protein